MLEDGQNPRPSGRGVVKTIQDPDATPEVTETLSTESIEQDFVPAAVEKYLVPRAAALMCALIVLIVLVGASHILRASPYNGYSLLADAFMHGHAWIVRPGDYIDSVAYNGHDWIVNDPLPAVLLAPFALLQGKETNQTVLAVWLCVWAVYSTFRVLQKMGMNPLQCCALTAFAFAGTDLLWAASIGDVWFLAQVSAYAFCAAMLSELAGAKRPILVSLFFSAATLSRFPVVFAFPAVASYLAYSPPLLRKIKKYDFHAVIKFSQWVIPAAMLWCAYNELRWGTFYDRGHTIFYHGDYLRGEGYGSPFDLANVPMQMYSFFIRDWDFPNDFPFIIPNGHGTALTWTSPALLLAFFVRKPTALVVALWTTVVLIAGPSFLYYANGEQQFGMRHALDFEPFLLVLMALAWKRHRELSFMAIPLIVISITAGTYGTWYWHSIVRP